MIVTEESLTDLFRQYLVPVSDFIAVRGILMILSMKISSLAFDKGHDFALSDAVPAFAFLFNPSTMVFGPFHTYGDFLKSMNQLSNALLSVSLLVVALSFLMYSSCLSIIVPEGSILADYFVAQSFRSSHFFVCLLSQALSMLSGMRISVCSPFKVEFPRSLVEVVTVWNMPMHRFLHVYLKFLSLGSAGSIFASFVVSSLLHGFNFQITAVLLSLGFVSYFENSKSLQSLKSA
uniref:Protein-serine O-palmitoleoyltransferase porcupine n=1 Tax=Angiostrongylus cantonensis TaxID=6313 RepID=A0A0K0DFZ9_ANGCA